MKKEDIFAPFYVENIRKEPFETKNMMPVFSLLYLLGFFLIFVKAVYGIPHSGLPWQICLGWQVVAIVLPMILLPVLYWDKYTGEYKGKRFRIALMESTVLIWFWLLACIPAGIVNFLKLLVMLWKLIYRSLKKSRIGQIIKNSVIARCTSFFQEIRKESILFILSKLIVESKAKFKKGIKAPFIWFRKIRKLWKENPILDNNH